MEVEKQDQKHDTRGLQKIGTKVRLWEMVGSTKTTVVQKKDAWLVLKVYTYLYNHISYYTCIYIYMYQWACVCVCVWTYMFNMYRQTREGQWSEHTKSRYQYPSLGQLPWTRGTRCEPLSPLLPPTYLALCGTGSCLAQLQHAVAKETKIKMNKAAAPVGGHVGFPPPDL